MKLKEHEVKLTSLRSEWEMKLQQKNDEIDEMRARFEIERDELFITHFKQESETTVDVAGTLMNISKEAKIVHDLEGRVKDLEQELRLQNDEFVNERTLRIQFEAKNKEYFEQNLKLLERLGKRADDYVEKEVVRVDNVVHQIVNKETKVTKYVTKDDEFVDIGFLTEQEKRAIRAKIKLEFKAKIKEMEANILAYQDMLLTKEDEIAAYAKIVADLQTKDTSDQ